MASKPDIRYVRFYTDGSAAHDIAPSVSRKTRTVPRIHKKRRRIIVQVDPVAIAGILMAGIMLILMTVGMVELNRAQEEAAQMEAYVHMLRQENEDLRAAFDEGYDLSQVERMAKALGMVSGDQAQRISIQIPAEQEQSSGFWENVTTFLSGLFA